MLVSPTLLTYFILFLHFPQILIQDYLHNGKGILHKDPKRLQSVPPASDVDTFTNDNIGGPTLEEPQFDWADSLDSPWNEQLIFMMATEVHPKIQDLSISAKLPLGYTSVEHLKEAIHLKMRWVCTSYSDAQPPPMESQEMAKGKVTHVANKKGNKGKKNRRNGCHRGVSDLSCMLPDAKSLARLKLKEKR